VRRDPSFGLLMEVAERVLESRPKDLGGQELFNMINGEVCRGLCVCVCVCADGCVVI
jgi:hypothetical protein